ncbi:MAG: D-glucuronyl C5-epimerase family protein [Ferruginibacter sp.]
MRSGFTVYSLLLLLSLVLAGGILHFTGDRWENRLRLGFYRIKGDSIPSYSSVLTDSNGVPCVLYKPLNGVAPGLQHNSTIVGNYAVDYYNQFIKTQDSAVLRKFKHCVKSLADSIHTINGYSLFVFYWQQPWYDSVKTPFYCGMTSGRAIEAFTDAWLLFRDSSYLQQARQLLTGYFLPIEKGGFTYQYPQGWWYEELADSNRHTPHILDGHIFAVTGVQKFWQLTRNDSAKQIVDKGLAALRYNLPRFDAGNGDIYYDWYQKKADQLYHETLARQMKELWQSTGDSIFHFYYKKWSAPLNQTYLLRIVKQKNRSGLLLFTIFSASIFLIFITLRRFVFKK